MFKVLYRFFAFSLLLALSINPSIADFDPASELKIIATDGMMRDYFGISISLSGNRSAVGAYYADVDGNSNQGAVYIYDFNGTSWNQVTKLTASDGATDDWFGHSVSLDGSRLAVGARGNNSKQGSVYVFDLSGGAWNQTAKITASDAMLGDEFGRSVSLDGDRMAVGANLAGTGENTWQGAAYVFDLTGGTWSETKLTASDGMAGDRFGQMVSLDGNRLAVGAYGDDNLQGSAYVFDLSGGTWSETTKLVAYDGMAGDYFGTSVSLDSNRLAVGAHQAHIGGNSNQGAAYVFDLSGGTWSQTAKLVASDGSVSDFFGRVSLDNDRLAVGAYRDDGFQGSVYIFNLNSGAWSETTKLVASDGVGGGVFLGDYFGASVSLDGVHLGVGARSADIGVNSDVGAAYVYTEAATDAPVISVPATTLYGMLLMIFTILGLGWFVSSRT